MANYPYYPFLSGELIHITVKLAPISEQADQTGPKTVTQAPGRTSMFV